MARRRQAGPRDRSRRVTANAAHLPWPHVQTLIDDGGSIVIGRVEPIPCAAVASDEHAMYAALVAQPHERLPDLLNRLDAALKAAFEDGIYTDEING